MVLFSYDLKGGKVTMNLQKARTGILMVLVGMLGVLGLAGCGGDNPTATPVAPTATTSSGTTTDATATTSSGTMTDATATTSSDAMEEATATTSSGTMEEATPTTDGSSNSGGGAIDLLTDSGKAMQGVKSYHMSMKVETAAGNSNIESDVEVPDKYRMIVEAGGVSTEVIIIGNTTYTKIPGTDQYAETPGDASTMTQANPSEIANVAQNATIVGDETLNGVDTTHVRYSVNVDDTSGATGASSATEADVWIEKSTGFIHQYKIVSEAGGVSSTTTIVYSKHNEPISPPIEKPANIMTLP
jgi:outer membrane lipoprotein-sorting protein